VPDVVPEDATEADIDSWIRRLNTAATAAEAAGNLTALASLANKVAALMALKHRLRPVPKADPNENPDMRALADAGEARLAALLRPVTTPT
jgi:hypothetical protein